MNKKTEFHAVVVIAVCVTALALATLQAVTDLNKKQLEIEHDKVKQRVEQKIVKDQEMCGVFEPLDYHSLEVIAQLEKMPTIKQGRNAMLKHKDAHTELWLKNDSTEFWVAENVNGKWLDKQTGEEF